MAWFLWRQGEARRPTPFQTPRRIWRAARRRHIHILISNGAAQKHTDAYLFAANSGAYVLVILLFPALLAGLIHVACL